MRRLKGMLQSDRDVPLNLAADELGVDSLVAVDIRSWFLKELDVDLPVLKILGGASVGDMLQYAVENISPSMIPKVGDATTDELDRAIQNDIRPELTSRLTPVTASDTTPQKLSESSSELDQSLDSQSSATSDIPVDEFKPEANRVIRAGPMSSGQSRFWFLQNYLADKTAFNIVTMITIQGNLRVADLSRAVEMVGHHHEALRTKFYVDAQGHAMQGVLERSTLALEHKSATGTQDAVAEFDRVKNHIYDLENGNIMQISLLSSGATHYLTIGYHHINMDGISLGVLLSDMHNAYRGMRLVPALQYVDYSVKQRQLLDSGAMKEEIKFWTAEFNTLPEVLPVLPFSRTTCRRPLDRYDAHVAELTVPLHIAAQLKRVVQNHRVSPFHIYLTVFRVLLTRLTDVQDIVIGMGDANRMESEVQNAVGMYLNLLPLRFRTTPKQTFDSAIKEAQSKVRKALAHSRMPFDALLELLQPPRSADAAPLFQAFIDYRQPMADRSRLFDCRIVKEEYIRGDTAYDVALDIIDTAKGDAHVQFTVPKLLYSESDVQVLLDTFMGLLDAFTASPTGALEDVPLYSEREVQKALTLGRGT
jgi:hybrid polyketide synthase / nonribosomal peptide synthetase ACE1